MPAFTATAPGKVILFGEHAVVYGQPAIAVPLLSSRARATILPEVQGKSGRVRVEAPQLALDSFLHTLADDHPIKSALKLAAGSKDLGELPACTVRIDSEIPPSAGLGSSAAVATALIRAFSAFLGARLSDQEVSDRVYEVEKIQHGSPSGIDNTVVGFQRPVFFQKDQPIEFLPIPKPFTIIVADSGLPGNTRLAVEGVSHRRQEDPERHQIIFGEIGEICLAARELILAGKPGELGELMDRNHALLEDLGVSSPELNELVQAAREGGALGAKLSGGGLGGHIIALVEGGEEKLCQQLIDRGAVKAEATRIEDPKTGS